MTTNGVNGEPLVPDEVMDLPRLLIVDDDKDAADALGIGGVEETGRPARNHGFLERAGRAVIPPAGTACIRGPIPVPSAPKGPAACRRGNEPATYTFVWVPYTRGWFHCRRISLR